ERHRLCYLRKRLTRGLLQFSRYAARQRHTAAEHGVDSSLGGFLGPIESAGSECCPARWLERKRVIRACFAKPNAELGRNVPNALGARLHPRVAAASSSGHEGAIVGLAFMLFP